MVNPRRVGATVCWVLMLTVASPPPTPSIVVTSAPEPWTVIDSVIVRFSLYVPGATTTVSPSTAATIAAWIVG